MVQPVGSIVVLSVIMSLSRHTPRRPPEIVGQGSSRPRSRTAAKWTVPILVGIALAVGFILLGPSLIGKVSFTDARLLDVYAPWAGSPPAVSTESLTPAHDTIDGVLPAKAELSKRLRDGDLFPAWDQFASGGSPLAATPNVGAFSLLALPYYVLPLWWAPGWVKFLGCLVAYTGTLAWCRSVGLTRPSAHLAGLSYSLSCFIVLWANWPQSNVAAWIPWLMWTAELIVRRPRPRTALPLAIVLALMWLEGFPVIVVYSLLTVAAYLLVRTLASRSGLKHLLATTGVATIGVLLGTALAAFQLVPFARQLSLVDLSYRAQSPTDSLPISTILTAVFPDSYGTEITGDFRAPRNTIEVIAYVGVVVVVLCVVALAHRRQPTATAPGLRIFAAGTAMTLLLVGWVGGPFLAAAQKIPLIGSSYIGRVRSILPVVLVLLAGVGLDALTARRAQSVEPCSRRASAVRLVRPALVWGLSVAATLVLARRAWLAAADTGDLQRFQASGRTALAFAALALMCCAGLYLVRRFRQHGELAAVFVLAILAIVAGGQGLAFARSAWATSPPEQVYASTPATRFLQKELGHDRYAAPNGVMFPNANAVYGLRSVTGHTFQPESWKDMILSASNGRPQSPTLTALNADADVAASPVLDRLGARYWVTDPRQGVYGEPLWLANRRASTATLIQGVALEAPIAALPIRAVIVQTEAHVDNKVSVSVEVLDRRNTVLAKGTQEMAGVQTGKPLTVPVADTGLDRAAVPDHVRFTSHGGGVILAGDSMGRVLTGIVTHKNDDLRLIHTGDALVYERESGLSRIRWAGTARVITDPNAQIAALHKGADPKEVLLSEGPGGGSGRDASVNVVTDGGDDIAVDVVASGQGWLVVADPILDWWTVRVDDKPAKLVQADHAMVAVAVPKGSHRVTMSFDNRHLVVGAVVSAVATLVTVGFALWPLLRRKIAGSPRKRAARTGWSPTLRQGRVRRRAG